MLNEPLFAAVRGAIEWAALGIEMLGAVIIVAGVLRVAITRGTVRFLLKLDEPGAYESYKHQIGRSLLLGLEFLVAGDVVRTFLSWSLTVEIEGRWPWQPRTTEHRASMNPSTPTPRGK